MQGKASATTLLGGLMEPLSRCLNPQSAREILSMQADDAARQRVEELAIKCDEGKLTPDEQAEYQFFVEVGDFIALLQAKARLYLAQHPAG
jgi:hypothetical protein